MSQEMSPGKPTTRWYSEAEKDRPVRMVFQLRKELGTDHGTIKRVAVQLGIGVESLRGWVEQREIDNGVKPGLTSAEAARIKELEQEVRELRRANQFTSVRFTERLDEIGARPSIGTVADSFDNALAETTNGLYKTECVYGPDAPRPWSDVNELELATLSWVHWFNHDRLHSHCGDVPPAEFEAAFYAAQQVVPAGVGNQ